MISPYVAPAINKPLEAQHDNVVNLICSYYGVTFSQINVRNRKHEYVIPRQVIMLFLMHYCYVKSREASDLFNLDRSTASHAKKNHWTIVSNE